MKGIRTVLSMGMAFVVSAAALAFAGCSKKEEELSYTRAAYQKYLAYAEAIGDEPQSYEDWLADLKGEKGDKGEDGAPGKDGEDGAPGKDGEDGTIWYTGLAADRESNTKVRTGDFYLETDTLDFYLKTEDDWNKLGSLQGQAGRDGNHIYSGTGAPSTYPDAVKGDIYIDFSTGNVYVHNGTSFIRNTSYNIKGPSGAKGPPGDTGKNGSAWFTSDGDPTTAKIGGVDGDFCLDTKNGAIYQKKAGTWQLICILQSAGGSSAGDELSPILEGTTAEVPDSGEGWYKVLLKTGEAKLTEDQIKSLRVKVNYAVNPLQDFCQSRFELSAESTAEEHVYFAVVPKAYVMGDFNMKFAMSSELEQKVSITGVTGDIKGKVEVKKWEPATVSSFGQEFDCFYCDISGGIFDGNKLRAKLVEAYADSYGDITELKKDYMCQGAAFFFAQSLYPEISGAKLKLEYGADAFINVNKLPVFAESTIITQYYYWIGNKAGTPNKIASKDTDWTKLNTEGFTYLTIDNPESNSDKYFFEFCQSAKDSNFAGYKDYDGSDLQCVVPLKLKVTKVS